MLRWLTRRFANKRLAEDAVQVKARLADFAIRQTRIEADLRAQAGTYAAQLAGAQRRYEEVLREDAEFYELVLGQIRTHLGLLADHHAADLDARVARAERDESQQALDETRQRLREVGGEMLQLREVHEQYTRLASPEAVIDLVSLQHPEFPPEFRRNALGFLLELARGGEIDEHERRAIRRLIAQLGARKEFAKQLRRVDHVLRAKRRLQGELRGQVDPLRNARERAYAAQQAAEERARATELELRVSSDAIRATWQEPLNAALDEVDNLREEIGDREDALQIAVAALKEAQADLDELRASKDQILERINWCFSAQEFDDLAELKRQREELGGQIRDASALRNERWSERQERWSELRSLWDARTSVQERIRRWDRRRAILVGAANGSDLRLGLLPAGSESRAGRR